MQKVRKLVTTIMIAALITAMEGTTILSVITSCKSRYEYCLTNQSGRE